MNIQIITITHRTELHQSWGITVDEMKHKLTPINKGMEFVPKYFIESENKQILQKIRIGYPMDRDFDPEKVRVGEVCSCEGISQQTIQVPYQHIYANAKTLNLYLQDPITDENGVLMHSDDIDHSIYNGLVILLIGKEYQYIRSSVSEELGEIVATFSTEDLLGCFILLNQNGIKNIPNSHKENTGKHEPCPENVLCCDTKFDESFTHIRLNITVDETSDTYLYPMIGETVFNKVKNPDVIKRLEDILAKDVQSKRKERKFIRSSKKLITNYYVVSNNFVSDDISEDEVNPFEELVEKHDCSEILNPESKYIILNVNTDEENYIIQDKAFWEVLDYMKKEGVKAFTLVDCKIRGVIFNELRPSYIFIIDETESLMDDQIRTLKCLRSN